MKIYREFPAPSLGGAAGDAAVQSRLELLLGGPPDKWGRKGEMVWGEREHALQDIDIGSRALAMLKASDHMDLPGWRKGKPPQKLAKADSYREQLREVVRGKSSILPILTDA